LARPYAHNAAAGCAKQSESKGEGRSDSLKWRDETGTMHIVSDAKDVSYSQMLRQLPDAFSLVALVARNVILKRAAPQHLSHKVPASNELLR